MDILFSHAANRETLSIFIGICFGVIARLMMLRTDYRQYPTYPHGKIIHISLGIIASGLGAVAVPALLNKDYTAITFLALAAQQFRDVRNMERQSLSAVDKSELVPRGTAYIEGIAMLFEGRNYLVIFSSFFSSLCSLLFQWYWGVAVGLVTLIVVRIYQSGKQICEIADVRIADVRVDGPDVYVDSVYIMNVGLEKNRQIIREHALGLLVVPKDNNAKVTLANLGQRQALLHNLSILLGVYRDTGEPALVPLAKLDINSGTLAVFVLPQEKNAAKAVQILRQAPVLENAERLPSGK